MPSGKVGGILNQIYENKRGDTSPRLTEVALAFRLNRPKARFTHAIPTGRRHVANCDLAFLSQNANQNAMARGSAAR